MQSELLPMAVEALRNENRFLQEEVDRWPHVKRNWMKTIQWLIDNEYVNHNFTDAEFGFNWWISGKSFNKFYADEVLQQKINFNE